MPHQPTRREALVQITAAVGASAAVTSLPPAASAQAAYEPKALTGEQFKILTVVVDMIIPTTDTPGAAAVGVDRMIDESLAEQDNALVQFLGGLSQLEQSGFADLDAADRVKLLREYSGATDARGDFFRLLKGLTVDYYYSTEVGLIDELGYAGNTALGNFRGCTHDEHQ